MSTCFQAYSLVVVVAVAVAVAPAVVCVCGGGGGRGVFCTSALRASTCVH